MLTIYWKRKVNEMITNQVYILLVLQPGEVRHQLKNKPRCIRSNDHPPSTQHTLNPQRLPGNLSTNFLNHSFIEQNVLMT